MTDTPEVEPEEPQPEPLISNWEFRDAPPTPDQVMALLKSLRPVWGVETADYAEFVQGLPQNQKVKTKVVKDGKEVEVTSYVMIWRLYMGVAGRVKMIEEAAEKNMWRVDFEPEPAVSPPGMLRFDDERIVYREYCVVWDQNPVEPVLKGRKPGTAWVPAKGGQQAAGSNPYEKVETSARGRSIAAWGFGVLPGTGIASLEEMRDRPPATATGQAEGEAQPRRTRGQLMQELLTRAEEVRQERGYDDDEQKTKLAAYVKSAFGIDIAEEGYTNEAGETRVATLDWKKVKDGQLQLTINQLTQTLKKLRDEGSRV